MAQVVTHSSSVEANTVLTAAEKFWYYFGCVVTFGGLYFHKNSVKRAMLEALLAHQAFNTPPEQLPGGGRT
jgi:hypothetical protein